MPADALTTPSDSGPDMGRYNELIGKADLLYGQGQKVAEVAGLLNALVESLQWEGKRADRFREEWDNTRALLSGWANDLVNLSEEVRAEAENILVE